jgi:hypothetical protein
MQYQIEYLGLTKLNASLDAFPAAAKAAERKFVIRCSALIKEMIARNTPVATGKLKSSLHVVSTGLSSVISVNAPYADYVLHGTSAHNITPSTKGALYWPNAQHPVRSVRHPGQKANNFVDKGLIEALPEIEVMSKLLAEELGRLI